jgi:hypothetical protein
MISTTKANSTSAFQLVSSIIWKIRCVLSRIWHGGEARRTSAHLGLRLRKQRMNREICESLQKTHPLQVARGPSSSCLSVPSHAALAIGQSEEISVALLAVSEDSEVSPAPIHCVRSIAAADRQLLEACGCRGADEERRSQGPEIVLDQSDVLDRDWHQIG